MYTVEVIYDNKVDGRPQWEYKRYEYETFVDGFHKKEEIAKDETRYIRGLRMVGPDGKIYL